jgi:hypothetical protein
MDWRPSVAQPTAQYRLDILGCRVHQMVTVVAREVIARVLMAVTVPWTGTGRAVSLPLVHSYGGNGTAILQEPGVVEPIEEEPCVEVLFMEEPSCFRRGRAGSSGELKPRLRW